MVIDFSRLNSTSPLTGNTRTNAAKDTAETGQSPAKAIESLRLEAARLLIEQSSHSLDVVARETGFRDRRHMREVFMRGFGVPPQAVRRDSRRMV